VGRGAEGGGVLGGAAEGFEDEAAQGRVPPVFVEAGVEEEEALEGVDPRVREAGGGEFGGEFVGRVEAGGGEVGGVV